jgi:hypothetical protein
MRWQRQQRIRLLACRRCAFLSSTFDRMHICLPVPLVLIPCSHARCPIRINLNLRPATVTLVLHKLSITFEENIVGLLPRVEYVLHDHHLGLESHSSALEYRCTYTSIARTTASKQAPLITDC